MPKIPKLTLGDLSFKGESRSIEPLLITEHQEHHVLDVVTGGDVGRVQIKAPSFLVHDVRESLLRDYAQAHPELGAIIGNVEQHESGALLELAGATLATRATMPAIGISSPSAPTDGVNVVIGAIRERYKELGKANFGIPATDETATPDGVGRFNHFIPIGEKKPSASIYWTPATGAVEISGPIRRAWADSGWETGPLGYPRVAAQSDGSGEVVRFERGRAVSSASGVELHPLPSRLRLRLRYMHQHASNDALFEGASDELALSFVGVDSQRTTVAADSSVVAHPVASQVVPNAMNEREEWKANPRVMLDFDLTGRCSWPRVITATLLVIDVDDQDMADTMTTAQEKYGDDVREAVKKGAGTVASVAANWITWGMIPPEITARFGQWVGEQAGDLYDVTIGAIITGLANDIFSPIPLVLTLNSPEDLEAAVAAGQREAVLRDKGAHDVFFYDWVFAD